MKNKGNISGEKVQGKMQGKNHFTLPVRCVIIKNNAFVAKAGIAQW